MKYIQRKKVPILATNLITQFSQLTKHVLRAHPTALDELPCPTLLAMYCALWIDGQPPSELSTQLLHRIISAQDE